MAAKWFIGCLNLSEICGQVAEKRKSLLDELAIKYQVVLDENRNQAKALQEEQEVKSEELIKTVSELKVGGGGGGGAGAKLFISNVLFYYKYVVLPVHDSNLIVSVCHW